MKYSILLILINERIKYSTVRRVAKQSKVSPATIHRIAKGHTPDLQTYFKLCKWLEVYAPFSNGFKNKKTK
jgi:transcriptional regulator with XRE-family HTH domain